MHVIYKNAMPFYIMDLSIKIFCYLRVVLEPIPAETYEWCIHIKDCFLFVLIKVEKLIQITKCHYITYSGKKG